MEDVEMSHCTPKKDVFYGEMADATLEFTDGNLPVSKALLAFRCPYFMTAFFGPAPKSTLKIEKYSIKDFKIFLDCLLGLKEYSISTAISTYAIAHEYGASEALEKYKSIFDMDKICDSLNHNLSFSKYDRVDSILTYIKSTVGVVKFLENAIGLQLDTIKFIIERIDLNSLVWIILFEWSKKKCQILEKDSIRSFLEENDILYKLKFSHFESVQSIIDFQALTNWELLDYKDFSAYLEANLLTKNVPLRSQWFSVGEAIKEKIELKNSPLSSGQAFSTDFNIEIWANQVFSPFSDLSQNFCVQIKVRYSYRTVKLIDIRRENAPRRGPDLFPRNYSDAKVFAWKNFEKFLEEPACSLTVNVIPTQVLIIESVEITYEFKNFKEFFILKSSLDDKFFNAGDNLFFTRNLKCV